MQQQMRFLDLMRPLTGVLPSIEENKRQSTFYQKLMWTAASLYIYLICS